MYISNIDYLSLPNIDINVLSIPPVNKLYIPIWGKNCPYDI